jgi:hypothetical protein
MKKNFARLLISLTVIALLVTSIFVGNTGCKKDDSTKKVDSITTDNSNGLQSVMTIPNGKLTSGTLPVASSSSSAPQINSSQSSASFNPGTQFQLPFAFTANTSWKYIYVYVSGATNGYIQVTNSSTASVTSGTIIVPILIPSQVKYGSFTIIYCVVDNNGLVSNWIYTTILLTAPITCANADVYGSEGLTQTNVDLGTKSGNVSINYDTYTVPDRIDVYQGNTWLAGTETSSVHPSVPPLCDCSTPGDGFIGATGTLTFTYNPSKGKTITVYVSGCLGGGTAWEWHIVCPN